MIICHDIWRGSCFVLVVCMNGNISLKFPYILNETWTLSTHCEVMCVCNAVGYMNFYNVIYSMWCVKKHRTYSIAEAITVHKIFHRSHRLQIWENVLMHVISVIVLLAFCTWIGLLKITNWKLKSMGFMWYLWQYLSNYQFFPHIYDIICTCAPF